MHRVLSLQNLSVATNSIGTGPKLSCCRGVIGSSALQAAEMGPASTCGPYFAISSRLLLAVTSPHPLCRMQWLMTSRSTTTAPSTCLSFCLSSWLHEPHAAAAARRAPCRPLLLCEDATFFAGIFRSSPCEIYTDPRWRERV